MGRGQWKIMNDADWDGISCRRVATRPTRGARPARGSTQRGGCGRGTASYGPRAHRRARLPAHRGGRAGERGRKEGWGKQAARASRTKAPGAGADTAHGRGDATMASARDWGVRKRDDRKAPRQRAGPRREGQPQGGPHPSTGDATSRPQAGRGRRSSTGARRRSPRRARACRTGRGPQSAAARSPPRQRGRLAHLAGQGEAQVHHQRLERLAGQCLRGSEVAWRVSRAWACLAGQCLRGSDVAWRVSRAGARPKSIISVSSAGARSRSSGSEVAWRKCLRGSEVAWRRCLRAAR